jgi:beta-lactamase regulating signal transducer with metallopeptidase domain
VILTGYILRTTLILALAFAATRLLRRWPAALRHVIWVCAFAVVALTPVLTRIGPSVVITSTTDEIMIPVAPVSSGPDIPFSPTSRRQPITASGEVSLVVILWIAGVFSFGIRMCNGWIRTRRLVRTTITLNWPDGMAGDPIRLAESDMAATAMSVGVFRPQIVLPLEHRRWDSAVLHAVLEHEISHVRRRDCLSQFLVGLICVANWFNPLVWIARSELVCESERACDDSVIRSGVRGSSFARDLLTIARNAQMKGSLFMSNAVTTKLESRIARLLDAAADRRPVTLLRGATGVAAALVLLLPIASVKAERAFVAVPNPASTKSAAEPYFPPVVPATQGDTPIVRKTPKRAVQIAQISQVAQSARMPSLAGVVHDPSGAIVPGAAIFLLNAAGSGAANSTVADAAGQWAISGLSAGTKYTVEVRVRGFKVWRGVASAGAGTLIDSDLTIGEVSEAVTVVAPRVAVPIPPAASSGPFRVGGNVEAAKLINAVKPIFPASLRDQGIEGVVRFQAIIGKTGLIENPLPVPGNAPPELVQVALAAIRQWQYEPTRLNGQPVAVLATIDVAFQIQ